MFIAIVGTRFSGKSTVEDYLVSQKQFTPVRVIQSYEHEESVLPVDARSVRYHLSLSSIPC